MSEYFLGVDGGQSSTKAVIGDAEGNIIGEATAGPCNHVSAAEAAAKFLRVMRECVGEAANRAGLAAEDIQFRAACLGMSGGPHDKSELLRQIIRTPNLLVTHDGQIALAGAMSGGPGTIVIAGTGSFAFGENASGLSVRAGGWGFIYGDEGSAFDVARQAVRAILREQEGWGAHTDLTPALLEATDTRDANELLHRLYTPDWPRARVATLAGIVDRIAESGDRVALDLMNNAAQQLAFLAAAVRRQLFGEDEPSGLAWVGGLFESTILLSRFRTLIELEGSATPGPPAHGPAVGALMLAYRMAGLAPNVKPQQI